jgi:death-on-curing protein
MLAQYGGLDGVRDESMLESALGRPRHLFEHGQPTLCELAACYAGGVIRNHPFNDGNKRTGFILAATFLEINSVHLTASEEDVFQHTLAFAANEIDEAQFATRLSSTSRPSKRQRK